MQLFDCIDSSKGSTAHYLMSDKCGRGIGVYDEIGMTDRRNVRRQHYVVRIASDSRFVGIDDECGSHVIMREPTI